MVKSMTGFGRSEISSENRKVTVELKSVNHRYLDVNIRMPKKLNYFDAAMRATLKKYASRGKIDVFITYEDYSESTVNLKYNEDLAREYMECFSKIETSFKLKNDVSVLSLAKCPDVLTMEEKTIDEEELWRFINEALMEACEKFVASRVAEGEHLKEDIVGKLKGMIKLVDFIEERVPKISEEYKSRLEEKVKEFLENSQIDESRIAAEVVLFADKICVDEETVRLKSHIEKMIQEFKDGGDVGRKLDFLAQEMNREANTILSKSNDIDITNIGIELKTEIEKIREQIQNIE
ncbi:MAG: YicC family protein [Lachnospiraceae bacterium]|nr:YicC family protein [Lachnospiraceae bacterium]